LLFQLVFHLGNLMKMTVSYHVSICGKEN
jgi:hypothetical protein